MSQLSSLPPEVQSQIFGLLVSAAQRGIDHWLDARAVLAKLPGMTGDEIIAELRAIVIRPAREIAEETVSAPEG